MPTAVVTGANSGIGNAWAQILIKESYDVIAVDMNEGDALKSLQCKTTKLDVTDPAAIKTFAVTHFGGDQPLDLLLNIAGIMLPQEQDSMGSLTVEALHKNFAVNAYGPILLTQALLPNLLKTKDAKIGTISSRVGSIGDNTSGGRYAYRASKTAVNSLLRTVAMEVKDKGVTVVLLHPGFVKSGLTEETWSMKDAVFPDEAASKLWGVVKSKGIEETGTFWHREGFELPW